jgi:Family of unknown function (DUF6698)
MLSTYVLSKPTPHTMFMPHMASFHQKLVDGKRMPHPHDLPLLLFDEATFDMDNLFNGFLRSEMLIRVSMLLTSQSLL